MRGPCPGAGWTSYARRRVPNIAATTGWTRGGATPSDPVINCTRGSRHTSIQSNRTRGRHNRMLFRCRLLRQWSSLPRWGAARGSGNVPSSWRRRADSCRNGAPRGPRLEPWCTPPLARVASFPVTVAISIDSSVKAATNDQRSSHAGQLVRGGQAGACSCEPWRHRTRGQVSG